MKILLVKPYNLSDHIQPSLGLGYLAASVRGEHDVSILDCIKERVNLGRLKTHLEECRPDVVGFQCYTFDVPFIKDALRLAKEIDKAMATVIGGPHPSAMPEETMRFFGKDLDYLFAGEAEVGLPHLLDILQGRGDELRSVPGLTWRQEERIHSNPKTVTEDLDRLKMPSWDLIHPEDYPESQHGAFFQKFPIAPIMITRGCPYSCTFCAGSLVSGRKVRKRSIDNVLAELKLLHDDYGIREFHVIDDNFTMDVSYAKEFLRRLKNLDLGMSWAVPNGIRMDTLDEELLTLMKETGLYLISLGIESGSDRILSSMKKGITTARIRDCVKLINRCDIDTAGFFIVGFPGETAETIRETIRFSTELKLVRANFFTYLPFPGSESYRELEAHGKLKGVDWEHFYFMNAAYVPDGLTRKELKALQRLAFSRFYLRPGIILYQMRSIKSMRHLFFLGKRFLRWIVVS
ncbi:MAG: radical SAM protein [Candidatus Omnitrophica bacterium]|nr:radical SAM protein [Candidatus Omnitrophota bacterium]